MSAPNLYEIESTHALHRAFDPLKCGRTLNAYSPDCGHWRVIDCERALGDGWDVLECNRCGKRKPARCNFDEDCS